MDNVDYEILTAKVVSMITNPALILFIALFFGNYEQIKAEPSIFFIFLALGLSLPFFTYLYYLSKHKTHVLQFASITRESRHSIFLYTILSFCLVAVLFMYTRQSQFWISNAMFLTILFGAFYLINKFIDKASVHSGVFSLAIFYMAGNISLAYAFFLFILPFICWSRITLHKHTWFQLMLGSVIGMFIGLLSWTF
jgi:hypothetical protein